MAKLILKKASTSKILHIFIQNSVSSDGSGLTGLLFNSGGLSAYYIRPGDVAPTAITLATATLGTYSSGGFKEVSSTNMPGVYEFDPPDAVLATGADQVVIMLKGATNMAPVLLEIQLTEVNLNSFDKTGYSLAANGLDSISVGDPGGIANHNTVPKLIVAIWRRLFKKTTLVNVTSTSGNLKTFADDGVTANTTQAVSDAGGQQTQEASS